MSAPGRSAAGERQVQAAHPGRSTWLSANAGSGKTRVLTDRVARLLLNEVPPQNILCLTYTKAAAGEMQNRLFRRLGEWAMKPDADLAAELAEIGVAGAIGADRLAQARRLFARAVETPGGLKIQTIHAFCAAILRQFPLEAQVGPRFREIDDRERTLLLRGLFDELADGPQSALVADFARHASAGGIEALLAEITGHAEAFEAPLNPAEIYDWFDLPRGASAEDLADRALGPSVLAVVPDLATHLATRSATSQGTAARLTAALGRARGRNPGDTAGRSAADAEARTAVAGAEGRRPAFRRNARADRGADRGGRLCRRLDAAAGRGRAQSRPASVRPRLCRRLPRPQGGDGGAGLRRPDPAGAAAVVGRLGGGMGALSAGRRHRPYPGRRGAGHQPGAMADHRAAGAGILQRRRHKGRNPAHDLRRRRPQAVDLFVPGRRAGGIRPHGRAFRGTAARLRGPRSRASNCSIPSARRR